LGETKIGELWPTNKKVIGAHVHPYVWTFWDTKFRPLGGASPSYFTRARD